MVGRWLGVFLERIAQQLREAFSFRLVVFVGLIGGCLIAMEDSMDDAEVSKVGELTARLGAHFVAEQRRLETHQVIQCEIFDLI